MRVVKFVLFIGILISLTTCTWKASDPNVCFSENILPIFISKCSMSGCHVAGSGRRSDFTTYEGIIGIIEYNFSGLLVIDGRLLDKRG